jgi:hypothetical protein
VADPTRRGASSDGGLVARRDAAPCSSSVVVSVRDSVCLTTVVVGRVRDVVIVTPFIVDGSAVIGVAHPLRGWQPTADPGLALARSGWGIPPRSWRGSCDPWCAPSGGGREMAGTKGAVVVLWEARAGSAGFGG